MECLALTKIKIGKNQIPEKPRLRKFTRENKERLIKNKLLNIIPKNFKIINDYLNY